MFSPARFSPTGGEGMWWLPSTLADRHRSVQNGELRPVGTTSMLRSTLLRVDRQGHREALELFTTLADGGRRSERDSTLDVSGGALEWQWEGLRHCGLFYGQYYRPVTPGDALGIELPWATAKPEPVLKMLDPSALPSFERSALQDGKRGRRLAGLDRLRRHERILRAGWMWLAGTIEDPGTGLRRSLCFPLLNVTVEMVGRGFGLPPDVGKAGDVRLHPLLAKGPTVREVDLLPIPFNDVEREVDKAGWAAKLPKAAALASVHASYAGFTVDELLPCTVDPRRRRSAAGLALIPGVAVYADPSLSFAGTGQRLQVWSTVPKIRRSAFRRIYGRTASRFGNDLAESAEPLHPTRPLDHNQRRLVRLSRSSPLLTVTGPPGTGKTHALCEVALDAANRGKSVLIAAKSPFAVEVFAGHLTTVEGVVPMLFGGTGPVDEFSIRMKELVDAAVEGETGVESADVERAADELDRCYERLAARADVDRLAEELVGDPERADRLQTTLDASPALTDELAQFIEAGGSSDPRGWWQRRKAANAIGLSSTDVISEARTRLQELEAWRSLNTEPEWSGLEHGSSEVGGSIERLVAACIEVEDRSWRLNAEWLRSLLSSPLAADTHPQRLLSYLAEAMLIGRVDRRDAIERLGMKALTAVAPIWLGTVEDVDDVLPVESAMFDLVILDEASHIDQPSAAGALLRSSRAIVCGDPRQLRHESSLGAEGRSTDGSIDVGRDSIFDHVAGVAPLVGLADHYRCDPHLIEFPARRFYGGNLNVATRSPVNDSHDLIDVHVVEGSRNGAGVNHGEVDAVVRLLQKELAVDQGAIGLVTPFQAQADAITDAVIERVGSTEIVGRHVEVGTVSAFQGAEFDLVIASWALSDGDPLSAGWSTLNDPSLFNVMVTRARRRMVVVTSLDRPHGLAGDYVRHGEEAPVAMPQSTDRAHGWGDEVLSALSDVGLEVEADYRVGSFVVNAIVRNAVGPNGGPVAICCRLGPDDVERELALHRLGWYVGYALVSEWSGRLPQLAVELSARLRR